MKILDAKISKFWDTNRREIIVDKKMPNVQKPNDNCMFLMIFRIQMFGGSKKKLIKFDKSVEAKAERHRRKFWKDFGPVWAPVLGLRWG